MNEQPLNEQPDPGPLHPSPLPPGQPDPDGAPDSDAPLSSAADSGPSGVSSGQAPAATAASKPGSGRQFLRTAGLVALAIGGLFGVDTFLAKTEESEGHIEAARLYQEGERLRKEGNPDLASNRIKDAIAIERDNRDYALALAQAELDGAHYPAAEQTLQVLLLADSTAGPANLTMARTLGKEGRLRESISYYHRAIYGQWKDDAGANRLQVRFELIDLLAQQDLKEELLAELLAVQDQAPGDIATRLRIGRLFLAAGSAGRAETQFREALQQRPSDAEAYAGLGEAEFSRGDYRAAGGDFSAAARLNPGDRSSLARLELSNQVLALDPMRRGLDARERLRRSQALLKLTLDSASACLGADPPQLSLDLVNDARKALAERTPLSRLDQSAETDLELAEKLWQVRLRQGQTTSCSPPEADDPLTLVLARTAQ